MRSLETNKLAADCPPTEARMQGRTGTYRDQFQGPHGRSYPGQPPRERNGYAFNMPSSELSIDQQAAAKLLFGDGWEDAMPRRSCSLNANVVLIFQEKAWSQLAADEKKAAMLLDMNEQFWNGKLAPFHDEFWAIPGVTLTPREFGAVLKTIRNMSRKSTLTKANLAGFLLSLEKLLLPSQGVAIAQELKASPSWETLLESNRNSTFRWNSRFHAHLVVACFLSDPERFVQMSPEQLNVFWDDDSSGCVWGNAAGRSYLEAGNEQNKKRKYEVVLTELAARRMVEPILTTGAGSSLAALPDSVVANILDTILGTKVESIDPFQVDWLYGFGVSLTVFFTPRSHAEEKANE